MLKYDSTANATADTSESFAKALTSGTWNLVKSGEGSLIGIVVSSHTSGTIEVRDGKTFTAGANLVFGTIALTADASLTTNDRMVYYGGAKFGSGILVYCGGTTVATALYR